MLHNLFPTALFSFSFLDSEKNKNKYLEYLYKLKEKDVGSNRSNVHSWHSSTAFHPLKEKEFSTLNDFIVQSVKTSIKDMGYDKIKLAEAESWCIISPKGAYNRAHVHPGAFLSGSYYVSSPTAPITFHDPRSIKAFIEPKGSTILTPYNAPSVSINPKEGDLLIFPSWLEHSVAENKSDTDRVILSFNFVLR